MKRFSLIAAGMFLAIASRAASPGPEEAAAPQAPILSTDISGGDLMFFTETAPQMALLAQSSELAQKRAVTPEVQAVAAAVWKEQTGAAAQLKSLAGAKNVPLTGELDGQGKKQLQALAKLKGVKFDKSYLDALGDAQDQLETSLEAGASSSDKDIKALAESSLETLKQERDRVRKLGL